jgi:LysR family hydrogen peroxide-inducible transcriptional activator
MNLRDLKYFIALADSLHFGKAAEACFVSQPSLSIQIKKLESTLGVELFERTNKSVLLTDIGRIIAEQARELLQQADNLHALARQGQDPFSGELNIGVISTLTSYF